VVVVVLSARSSSTSSGAPDSLNARRMPINANSEASSGPRPSRQCDVPFVGLWRRPGSGRLYRGGCHPTLSPQRTDLLDSLEHDSMTSPAVGVIEAELRLPVARAETELQAATADDVDDGGLLGDQRRGPYPGDQDRGPDPNVLGSRRLAGTYVAEIVARFRKVRPGRWRIEDSVCSSEVIRGRGWSSTPRPRRR
jgi:hypothetical protein